MYPKCVLMAAMALLSVITPAAAEQNSRPIGDSKMIAGVPAPGYPEGIAVGKKNFYVAGPAVFGPGPGVVWVYDLATGALMKTIAIGGFAGSCIALDDKENIYVIEESQGVVKIDARTGAQTVYGSGFYPFNPPSPYLLNDLAFDKKGNLYVTDSFQATIWRVPPGGGAAQVWFHDARLDGPFGPNGIRVDEDGEKIYFTTTFDGVGIGRIWTLPVKAVPTANDLKTFYTYSPGAGPDGIAFGKSGNLYVALAGYSQISEISEQGHQVQIFNGPAANGSGAPLPWQNPANIAFNDKTGSLLVTNHASMVANPQFAVFDVYVDDKAGKLF